MSPPQTWKKEVKTAAESCYGSVSARLVFTLKRVLPAARKVVLFITQKSSVIYEYKYHCDSTTQKNSVMYEYKYYCDSRYVGQTSQRLQDRIKQHALQRLRKQLTRPRRSQPHRLCKRNDTKLDCDSAIGQHLLENEQCALNYDNKRVSILVTARSSFQLNLLEAAYIKTQRPMLCRQKELSTLSNSFDNSGVPIWPLAALPLAFRFCKMSFFGALYNPSAINRLSWLSTFQINYIKLLTPSSSCLFDAIPPLMRASRKVYG